MAKTGSKAMLAGIIGLATGIGIGMLIAPSKGSKTRKRLKKRFMGFANFIEDGLTDKINAIKSSVMSEEGKDLESTSENIEDKEGQ